MNEEMQIFRDLREEYFNMYIAIQPCYDVLWEHEEDEEARVRTNQKLKAEFDNETHKILQKYYLV